MAFARGLYLHGITRHVISSPVLRNTESFRGDVVTITGGERHIETAIRAFGVPDRQENATDMVLVAVDSVIGAFVGLPHVADVALPLGWRIAPDSSDTALWREKFGALFSQLESAEFSATFWLPLTHARSRRATDR